VSWRLYDSALATVLAEVTVDPAAWNTEAAFLSDGRVVVSTETRSQLALDVFDTGGERRSSLRLTTDGQPHLAGEPGPGLLLVSRLGSGGSTLVNLETGETRNLGGWPSQTRWGWAQRSTLPRGRAARLMVSPDRSTLLELDPETLQLTPLLGAGATARR
jgi:hypothetical protein